MQATDIIATLQLEPHPEGGWYRQTWVADGPGRPSGTCIYFLLPSGESSHWHRVNAVEIWHFHAGAPLVLRLSATDAGPAHKVLLGVDLMSGARPQAIVPAGWWQAASTTGAWSLASCTVSPGFGFAGFTLAPAGFDIPG